MMMINIINQIKNILKLSENNKAEKAVLFI